MSKGEFIGEYVEYLKSDDWKERRKEMMDEANWTCSMCGGKATQLHHLNYNNLGFEILDEDVIALCTQCHKDIHNKEGDGDNYGDYGSYTGYEY